MEFILEFIFEFVLDIVASVFGEKVQAKLSNIKSKFLRGLISVGVVLVAGLLIFGIVMLISALFPSCAA